MSCVKLDLGRGWVLVPHARLQRKDKQAKIVAKVTVKVHPLAILSFIITCFPSPPLLLLC